MATNDTNSTIYFGYGSNLWKQQMTLRCPKSEYLGIARLNRYQWIINERGYANVVEVTDPKNTSSNEVWGLVYSLQPSDEENLDINEGVPEAYTKEDLSVDYWPAQKDGPPKVKDKPQQMDMLVYVDRKRMEPDVPKKEYIYRMNMGIKDAGGEGMPETYVQDVMRRFIPDEEDEKVAEFARQQAVLFEDER